MVTKDQFENIIAIAAKYDKELNEVSNIINFEHPIFDYFWKQFYLTINILFSEEGVDWIYWWIWDKPSDKENSHAWDKFGKEIPTESISDLWNIVKEYRR